ncbi:MAG TPA: adenylyltransferase/cytidyltransferase family protein [Candidatus Nanoarchaeia archaeon]|nr:adenylyltransferase/cytidyltransferase family protein [Candidatus Nanoarchaeia archaeon]
MNLLDNVQDRASRIVLNYGKLAQLAQSLHGIGLRTVVTIGTFDMIHVGHSRYLERARSHGDILIVGVDSDRAVKIYKDETRPMVPEDERMEMLLHTRYVDFVTLVDDVDDDGKWAYGLVSVVKPSTFVAVEDSYPQEQLQIIESFCDELVVLPRQAETSTSETMRRALMAQTKPVGDQLRRIADKLDKGEL